MEMDIKLGSNGGSGMDIKLSYLPSTTGQIKVYTGSSFEVKPVKVFNGVSWEIKPLKRYDGVSWVETNY